MYVVFINPKTIEEADINLLRKLENFTVVTVTPRQNMPISAELQTFQTHPDTWREQQEQQRKNLGSGPGSPKY